MIPIKKLYVDIEKELQEELIHSKKTSIKRMARKKISVLSDHMKDIDRIDLCYMKNTLEHIKVMSEIVPRDKKKSTQMKLI